MSKKNKETQAENQILLSKLTTKDWIVLGAFSCLVLVGVWQAALPYFAERHYRDAYNFEVYQRPKYAIEEYEAAVKLAPWETQYQMDLAKALSEFGMQQPSAAEKLDYLNRAEQISLHMIELDEKNPWYKNRIATIYLMMAEVNPEQGAVYTQKAEEYIRESAKNDKKNPLFLLNLAYFLHRTKRLDEAIMYYNKTLEIDDRLVEANFNLADIYRSQGNMQKTLEQYLQVYKMKPDFPNINTAIASTYMDMFSKTNNITILAKAIPFLEADLKQNSANLDILKNLASIYFQVQDWKNAAKTYEQILLFYPNLNEFKPLYQTSLARSKS